jgi:hypothetical protein
MEQEQATMSVSLETPTEIVGQEQPVTPPAVETPPPAAVTDDAEPDETIAAANGRIYVPLEAVKAERGRRQTAEAALKAKDAEFAPIKQKAQAFDEAKQYLDQAKPYIEKAKADLQRQSQPQTPAVDPRVEQYAKDFDLYTAEGKPDIDRAQRIIAFHREDSKQQAQQIVSPILQTEAARTAQSLYQQYAARPEVNGVKVDGRMLAEAFNMVGPEVIAANPAVAEVLYMNTIGRQLLSGQKPITAPAPVVPTESIGGGGKPEYQVTATSEKFMQAGNIKPSVHKEASERYKAGLPNSLE